MENRVYNIAKEFKLKCDTVFEVGVYIPEQSQSIGFINDGSKCVMFEPLPNICSLLRKHFSNNKNVVIHQIAIGEKTGVQKLYLSDVWEQSATLNLFENSSPLMTTNGWNSGIENLKSIDVSVGEFKDYDSGDIDILIVDAEGSEWFVIKDMVSRPQLISLEVGNSIGTVHNYTNYYLKDIELWMKNNGYEFYERCGDDVYYIRRDKL